MKRNLLGLSIAPAFSGLMQETQGAEAGGATKKKEKPKISVTMEDSRVVEFPEDTKAKKAVLIQASDGNIYERSAGLPEGVTAGKPVGVRWDFSNGKTRTVMLSDLPDLQAELGVHGLSQKGGDEYASEKEVDDAVLAFDDLMDRLKKGEWSERREGGGFGGASILAKAIAKVFGKSEEEVRAFLRDLKPAEKMALRQTPELKPEIERLEAEKASGSKVDVAGILGKLKPAA